LRAHILSNSLDVRVNRSIGEKALKISLNEVIIKSACAGLSLQSSDGSMPTGHNGPWNIPETPVRNTAHWAMTFYKAYDISGENHFRKAAVSACDYLFSKKARPRKRAFSCLVSSNPCNGLIGQAWAIEPLVFLGDLLNRQEYLTLSREVLLLHRYEEKFHMWRNSDLDGRSTGLNYVLNHQLWFAAFHLILGRKLNDEPLMNMARDFFTYLNYNMSFLAPGLIQHRISQQKVLHTSLSDLLDQLPRRGLRHACIHTVQFLRDLANNIFVTNMKRKNRREVAIGYFPFVLYGFALAYAASREELWWRKPILKGIFQAIFSLVQGESYYTASRASKYGWTYNPIGFEVSYALNVFQASIEMNGGIKSIRWWLERQLENHWNPSSGLMELNTKHPITLSARLYEATRLQDMELTLSLKGRKN